MKNGYAMVHRLKLTPFELRVGTCMIGTIYRRTKRSCMAVLQNIRETTRLVSLRIN